MKLNTFAAAVIASALVSVPFAAAGLRASAGESPVKDQSPAAAAVPTLAELRVMTARFAPADIGADITSLPDNERRALARLIEAAKLMDSLFLRQVWAGNDSMLQDLARAAVTKGSAAADARQAEAEARLHYFLINKGPWSRLDHNRIFIPGAPPKPESANFYPEGAQKEDVQRWIDSLSGPAKAAATGFFTAIRWAPASAGAVKTSASGTAGNFTTVPYSLEYQPELARAAALLREAADLTAQPTLKRFLTSRADAFLSNDYYESDVAWMELDASIEPTIGPYEVYEDEWFNYKAAFEAFVTVRDEAESKRLQAFSAHLQELENALPIDPKYRNPQLGSLAPIRVVNVVFAAGDGNRGVQTAAYNLPNDERVVQEKGTKRVMLKNMQDAKFNRVLVPISKVALSAADQRNLSFDAFFTHILMHELMHGLGPHNITVGGRATTVRQELKETYSAIEEAKADVSGLWALQQLADRKLIDPAIARTMYTTFLASAFRSIRFGINEAHGRGIAVQLNYLLDAGAFKVMPGGTFAVDETKIVDAVTALTREIMTLQAEGSYQKAKDLIDRLGTVRPQVQKVLDRLAGVPVDIEPKFTTAERLR
jgi:tetratricopeptide (TPR) repeat protein